jgi:ABC-type amino acid transport substrate-binding protein
MRLGWIKSKVAYFGFAATAAAALVLSACGSSSSSASSSSNPYHLIHPGELIVGMDLEFKPEMYINSQGKPAGYDVAMLKALAKYMHVKLVIDNLTFTGLIPGLEAHKFDMLSVGLAATPQREKVVSFTRPYVPYQYVLAVPEDSNYPPEVSVFNSPSMTIAALQGSTDAQLVQSLFPKAHLLALPNDTSALLDVATHRANAAVVESYILGEFQKSNPNEVKNENMPTSVMPIYYGNYAVQKGNTAFVKFLNKWICMMQTSGQMAKIYEETEGVSSMPPMPPC